MLLQFEALLELGEPRHSGERGVPEDEEAPSVATISSARAAEQISLS